MFGTQEILQCIALRTTISTVITAETPREGAVRSMDEDELCHPPWSSCESHDTIVCTENITGMIAKANTPMALCR